MSKDADVNLLVREVQKLSLRVEKLAKELDEFKEQSQSNHSEVLNRIEEIRSKL